MPEAAAAPAATIATPAAAPAKTRGHVSPDARAKAIAQMTQADKEETSTAKAAPAEVDATEAARAAASPSSEVVDAAGVASAVADPKQAAIKAAREATEQKAREFQAKRDKVAADYARRRSEADREAAYAQRETQLAERMKVAEQAEKDPFGYLAGKGLTAKDLVEKGLKQGTPEAKLAELEARIAARDAADEKREQARQTAEREANMRRVADLAERYEAGFASTLAAAPEAYPHLAEVHALSPEAVRLECAKVAKQYHQETGETAPHEWILTFVETEIGKRKAVRAGSAGKVSGSPAGSPAVATLTSAQSGATSPAPALTQAQRRAAATEQIRRMRGE